AEHEIIVHPASNAAQSIIRKQATNNHTSFLGLAIYQKKSMLGFKTHDQIIGLANINIDEFETIAEAEHVAHHLAWHTIDLFEIRREPLYRKKFANGPMVPKRSSLNLSKANLQADIYAALLLSLKGKTNNLDVVKKRRAIGSLVTKSQHKPEDYPFLMAQEACQFAIEELMNNPPAEEDYIKDARNISLDIGQAFDEMSIRQWWNYATPAQDMAWRGFSKKDILGAAVNTCDDTFVRATGLMVAEAVELEPSSAESIKYSYNAFLDTKSLAISHAELVDTVFEEAISMAQGDDNTDGEGSRALIDAANRQNEDLTEGRILGWCANALQEAAQAFEKALSSGASPSQAARMQFEGNKGDTSWDMLKELGEDIIDQRRQGFAVTMGHIAEIAHSNPAFAPVLGSLKMTMNDPTYTQKLEAANDLSIMPAAPTNAPSLGPKGPAPKAPGLDGPKAAPSSPAPTNIPAAGPSLGGGSAMSKQIMQQKQLAAQKAAQEKSSQDGAPKE
ncbi:MAG: hypothetical protein AAF988_08785, partial [Pseudomonadota bacterium]